MLAGFRPVTMRGPIDADQVNRAGTGYQTDRRDRLAPVLRDAELRKLLDVCAKDRSFAGRRDEAMLRVLMDTGIRRAEILGLQLVDVDLDQGLLRVTGKGSRTRVVAIGANTVQAIDR